MEGKRRGFCRAKREGEKGRSAKSNDRRGERAAGVDVEEKLIISNGVGQARGKEGLKVQSEKKGFKGFRGRGGQGSSPAKGRAHRLGKPKIAVRSARKLVRTVVPKGNLQGWRHLPGIANKRGGFMP